jgi:hypothetical protein
MYCDFWNMLLEQRFELEDAEMQAREVWKETRAQIVVLHKSKVC